MKKTGYIIISAVLSLLLHLGLLGVAGRIRISDAMDFGEEAPPKPLNITRVDPRDLLVNQPDVNRKRDEESADQIKGLDQVSAKMKKIFRDANLDIKNKPKVRLAKLGRNLHAPELSRERFALHPPAISKIERAYIPTKYAPSLLSPGMLQGGRGATFDVGMRMGGLPGTRGLRVGDLPPADYGDGALGSQNGFSPVTGGPGFGGLGDDLPDAKLPRRTGGAGENGFRALDPYVLVNLTVYEDRGGGGYFRADIAANPKSEELWDVPKDLLFVIDHSTSISSQKLEQFKASTIEALQYLNPKDRFNVVSFTTQPRTLFPDFVPYTEQSMAEAQDYVRKLSRGGMTDVFGSISPFIRKSNGEVASGRPMNVFLMTDGNSTVNIYDDDKFVRSIKEMNPGNVSVYAFSAGKKANRDLLEFLGYHNRGYSLHVADLKEFKSMLVDYISTHSQLILADVNYQVADGLSEDTFPRVLPHLYREETLSFYGRFPAGTEKINVRVAGRGGDGEPYELVFWKPIKECLRGSPEMAQQWAAQKVFHLVGQRVLTASVDEKTAIEGRIKAIADKFNLYVPY
jgi:hypothetical protein